MNLDAASGEACVVCGEVRADLLFVKRGWPHVRCRGCGLVALRPKPTAAQLAAHHDASYAEGQYAEYAAAVKLREAIARDRLRRLRPLAPAGPWLDVGAGTGAFVAAALESGVEAEGIELSTVAIEHARTRGLPIRRESIESFRPTRRYAVVTALDVLEHLPEPVAFLQAARDWLLPGGLLGLTMPDPSRPLPRVLGRRWFYYVVPDHLYQFTAATVRPLLARAGFVDVRVRPVTKPMTIAYTAVQAEHMAPFLRPVAWIARVLPPRLRDQPLPVPLGEMLVTARPG